MTRGRCDRYAFNVGLLHPLLLAQGGSNLDVIRIFRWPQVGRAAPGNRHRGFPSSFLLNPLMSEHAAPLTTHHHASPTAAERVGLRGRFSDAQRQQPRGDPDAEEVAQGAEIMAKRQMNIGVT